MSEDSIDSRVGFFFEGGLSEYVAPDNKPYKNNFLQRRFSWRDNGSVLAYVSDQRPFETCLSHCLMRALETVRRINNLDDVRLDANQFHECVIGYNCYTPCYRHVHAAQLLWDVGAPEDFGTFAPGQECPGPHASSIRSGIILEAKNSVAAKSAIINEGPIVAFIPLDESFMNIRSLDIYFYDGDPARAPNHAILIVGFDDVEKCWEVQNSYGADWGEGGFGRISYTHPTLVSGGNYSSMVITIPR